MALYQDIASFLSESPEWVECWLNASVKKTQSQKNRLSFDFPDFAVSFFETLHIEHFDKSLKLNRDWYNECMRELEKRRKYYIKKYWDTIEEYKVASKALDDYWKSDNKTLSEYARCSNNYKQLVDKKTEDFKAWVDVDQAILRCGFHDLIGHTNPKYYINMYEWGMDPYEIPSPGNDPEGILDYWGDEDPDI